MIRLRYGFLVVFFLVPSAYVNAQDKSSSKDKPPSPWVLDRSMTVSASAASVPALKYRLLPISSELKEGNAVPIYLRLVHEQSDAARKYWFETPIAWNSMPIDKIPLDEADKFLQRMSYQLKQLEFGARRRTAEWNYTLEIENPIALLLPDAQSMRSYAPMLNLQARVAIAKGDFNAAARHLETGFAFSRHVADGPTLINRLVGIALTMQFAATVGDLIERPDSPNLYWSLTALPRPMIDLRSAIEWEYRMLEMLIPELDDLDRERTPEQWAGVLRRYRTTIQELAYVGSREEKKLQDWFPKDYNPDVPAAKSPDLPAARKFVARTKHLTAEQLEAKPPAQVLLLYTLGTYQEYRDAAFRYIYLPPAESIASLLASDKQLFAAPVSEGQVAARLFLPALNRVVLAQSRLDRNLAALRIVEALRIYAASHDGGLPEKLSEVTEVPIPEDPGTGKPFDYSRDGDAATLSARTIADSLPNNGVRYRVTMRKK
ncbi:MAG TPA: hypothetical protein VG097_06085 [Gemmata sp.]|jgi:hypothetical protein|nr:hypothetical protein [Gemmata sp.]